MWQSITKQSIRNIIAVIYILGAFIYTFLLIFKAVPDSNRDLITTLGGIMIGGTITILGYFFGSSKNNENEAIKGQ